MASDVTIAFVTGDRCDHSDKVSQVERLHDDRVRGQLRRVRGRSIVAGEHDQSGREAGPELVQVRDNWLGAIGTREGVGDDHVATPPVDRRTGSICTLY